jgi:hypothetical protein
VTACVSAYTLLPQVSGGLEQNVIFSQVLAWFADPTHWRGPAGVPVRVAEHLYYTAVAVLLASAVAVPVGLLVGHTGRGGVVLVGWPTRCGRCRPLGC